jgi:Kae1-associated kinase Bud32
MKVIAHGAEAVLHEGEHDGRKSIIKERLPKKYRIKILDESIRSKRTKQEVRLLSKARRAGVPVPSIIDFNSTTITMEKISGDTVKDSVMKSKDARIFSEIGECIGLLHTSGIIHGDLTTANMIHNEDKVYFIDFGLGKISPKIEDQANDLFLLFEALKSTHHKIRERAWENVLNAYKRTYLKANEVLKRLEQIKTRRRYK